MYSAPEALGASLRFNDADVVFATAMIQHHEGAVEMAQAEQADGTHAEALALAEDIESAQEDEITKLESLLGS